ncbi:hypothetical protein CPB84DRAFT_1846202 [Gymnopilus junonius]|uniref:Nephrocystin 3-like N-terminal domain-containing protein n=1 Tax=Gymnopilus junonius TaxID=109634 RepID=A0A9P5NSQ7_GYMJU|nr:hypothetical protein CPB84DRAFT_1846202 [Gymnopilus junonius]
MHQCIKVLGSRILGSSISYSVSLGKVKGKARELFGGLLRSGRSPRNSAPNPRSISSSSIPPVSGQTQLGAPPAQSATSTPSAHPTSTTSTIQQPVIRPSTSKDRIGPTLDVISQVLKATTAAKAFFPPVQSVIGGLSSGVNMAKVNYQNKIEREVVKKNLEEVLKRIERCKGSGLPSVELSEMIIKLQSDLKGDIGSIDEAMNESWWKRWAEGDVREMARHYGRFSSKLSVFITETVIGADGHIKALAKITAELKSITEKNYAAISQLQVKVELKDLNCALEAEYDTGPIDLRRSCTHETREQVLTDLMTWATHDTNTQIYWLSGMAGIGKTTIAYSFCERLREAGLLSSSFFCSRGVTTSTDPRALLPTISYHLSSYSPFFTQSLLLILRNPDNVNIRQKDPEKQFECIDPSTSGGIIEFRVKDRPEAILNKSPTPVDGTMTRPHDELDRIYTQILSSAEKNQETWNVLLVILMTQNPLTSAFISAILDFKIYRVSEIISSLHSVLTIQTQARRKEK